MSLQFSGMCASHTMTSKVFLEVVSLAVVYLLSLLEGGGKAGDSTCSWVGARFSCPVRMFWTV